MASSAGAPGIADITSVIDPLASLLRSAVPTVGIGDPAENVASPLVTLAAKARRFRDVSIGDGSTNYVGIANVGMQAQLVPMANKLISFFNSYTMLAQGVAAPLRFLDQWIQQNVPSGWLWQSDTGQRALDLWLYRMNGAYNGTQVAPVAAPVLTAAGGGALKAQSNAANAPGVVYTYVGTYDWQESLPSAEATRVALTGANNAYNVSISAFPAGVRKVRFYRTWDGTGYAGGTPGAGPYFWDSDWTASTGIVLKSHDAALNTGWTPPSWLSCMMGPEQAIVFALAYLASISGSDPSLGAYSGLSLMAPENVSLCPASRKLGIGNQDTSGIFRSWTDTVQTAGSIPTANVAASGIQGFAGAANGIQARVTSALDQNTNLTVTYTYTDAANTTPQTATSGSVALTKELGSTVSFAVTAGRLVKSVTAITVASATTGTLIIEAIDPRSI
jgi:hypothetical protein